MVMLKLGRTKAWFRTPGLINYAILTLAVLIFMVWRLGSLTTVRSIEASSQSSSANLSSLSSNAINAPYRLAQHWLNVFHPGLISSRLTSVVVAVIIIVGFYLYLKSLFGRIIGLFGALLMLSLPFFTITSRTAAPQIMLFIPALLIYLYFQFIKSGRAAVWLPLCVLIGLSIYTPGLLWWVAGGVILTYKKLSAGLSSLSKFWLGAGL